MTDSPPSHTRVCLQAMDVPISLEVADPQLRQACEHVLGSLRLPTWATTGTQQRHDDLTAVVRVDGDGPWNIASAGLRTRVVDGSEALAAVLTAVNLSAVVRTRTMAMHAAVLGHGSRTMVLPGPSGQGKSTLTAALVRVGWTYVSDEALCLQWDDGSLVSYPRPLSLSPWAADRYEVRGTRTGGEVIIPPEVLRPGCAAPVGASDAAITDLVLFQRRHGAPLLAPAHRAHVTGELFRRGFTLHHDAPRALQLLGRIASRSRCWQLELDEPERAAELLTSRLL